MADSNDQECINNVVVVAVASAAVATTKVTVYFMLDIPMEPNVNKVAERKAYMETIIFDDRKCRSNLRMGVESFHSLCALVREQGLLRDTRNCQVEEQLMRFLHIIRHNVCHRVLEARFYRSLGTISRQFNETLIFIVKLYKCLVEDHGEAIQNGLIQPQITEDSRFTPYFKDCLGALDGTHIIASVPEDEQIRFRSGRKNRISQNVLAVCSFDLKFRYVLAGWEGTAHDQKVLDNARTRFNPFVVPPGKYYLGDAGYIHEPGFLAPYRNTRYHINEHRGHVPENHKELFNKRHASLRNAIEGAFGVLKKQWPLLSTDSFYPFKTQVNIAMAYFVLHNHVMGIDPNDPLLEEVDQELQASIEEVDDAPCTSNNPRNTYRAEQAQWVQFRENMAW